MGDLKPTYQESIDVSQSVHEAIGSTGSADPEYKAALSRVSIALTDVMESQWYSHHGSQTGSPNEILLKTSATTPEDISVTYLRWYRPQPHAHPGELKGMRVDMHSFRTPLNGLKEKLTDIIERSCKEQ